MTLGDLTDDKTNATMNMNDLILFITEEDLTSNQLLLEKTEYKKWLDTIFSYK